MCEMNVPKLKTELFCIFGEKLKEIFGFTINNIIEINMIGFN
jgi:hypothetical protein